jgi:nicotinamide-nucleotide amidase
MKAAIITIGDEILIGQTIDTNSAWIGHHLHQLGIEIIENCSIQDKAQEIRETVDRLFKKSNFIIVTGGLGPTNDDITKETLTDYFGDELKMNEKVLGKIEDYFKKANKPMLEVHKSQALLPSKARVLENSLGTAAGMWFKDGEKNLISLPGVPYEMRQLITDTLPVIQEEFNIAAYYQRTVHFQGIVESTLADENSEFEKECCAQGIGMAYLPSVGIVRIRLTGKPEQKEEIDQRIEQIGSKYPKYCFGYDDINLAQAVGGLLSTKNVTVGTVESCTSGALAAKITSISGSSNYFMGSIVSYANRIKSDMVGVSMDDLIQYGAVSQQVVESMAKNGRKKLNVDYCISTSGIAGPGGGTPEKPVGTIWIAVDSEKGTFSRRFNFRHNRERNLESTVVYALNFLRRVMLDLQS